MKRIINIFSLSSFVIAGLFLLTSFLAGSQAGKSNRFPYKRAGLTERQAAERLLDRFSYGATPGQIDSVLKMGLENWFDQQLNSDLPDDSLQERLRGYEALNLSNTEVCHQYPPGFVIRSMAIKDSVISKDSVDKAVDKKAFNALLQAYMDKKGFKSDQDLYKQFISQHILRAIYSHNQLKEVLTDFWFNHFNVSFFRGECAQFIPAYERDVIRPNALGKFDNLLLASAQSPAMLYYLDNFTSAGPSETPMPKGLLKELPKRLPKELPQAPAKLQQANQTDNNEPSMMMNTVTANKPKTITRPGKNVNGLNENYAREVMELHTLGVDGGYTQQDVTQAARVLTGWTVYPISDQAYGSAMKGLVAKIGENNLAQKGFYRDSDFLFTPNRHDQGEKVVLEHHFAASTDPASGYQEGVDLLELLAHHPSTAQFICRKLAVRFVSDNPPQSLIHKMAKSFMAHDGDIKQVLITMVSSREFWDKKATGAKTKSPFELAVSAVRGLNAEVKDPYPLFNWIARMGQKIYYYQAPTGFPDRGQYWINTGSLLARMDFGLALASGQVPGIKVDWGALSDHHNQVSPQETIRIYSRLLLPDQDPDKMIGELSPLLKDSTLGLRLNNNNHPPPVHPASTGDNPMAGAVGDMMFMSAEPVPPKMKEKGPEKNKNSMQTLTAGIIIGSPEFQRR